MRLLLEHKTDVAGQHDYAFWCPACKHAHIFSVGGNAPWGFNGNFEKPSFTPSLKTVPLYCHLYVNDGQIQYCGDALHELKGQMVPMVDWETILPPDAFETQEQHKEEEKPAMKQIDCAACGGTGKVEAAPPAEVDAKTKQMAIGYITSITGDRENAPAMAAKIGHARVAQACVDGKDPFHLDD